MNIDIKASRRKQLDKVFLELKENIPLRPKNGWIAEIRTLLLMTTAQLAHRIGVAQSVVSNFEISERSKTISLQSLEKIAQALECDLHYFFVPRKGLENELFERAEKLYNQNDKKIEHHMRLEGQGANSKENSKETARETAERVYKILSLYKEVWERK